MNSAARITRDIGALYIALHTAYQGEVFKNIFLKHEDTSNRVAAWQGLIEKFGNDGEKKFKITKL